MLFCTMYKLDLEKGNSWEYLQIVTPSLSTIEYNIVVHF